jgi:hypothetical protein
MARTSRNCRLTKQHRILDFTKVIMLAEGKHPSDGNANRVGRDHGTEREDWGIGGRFAGIGLEQMRSRAAQTTSSDQNSSMSSGDSTEVKIARAMSAGPASVANAARIVDTDTQGNKVVLRAVAKARKLGVTENVAILDDGSNLKAFGRVPLLQSGAIKPIVAKTFRLSQAADALPYLIEERPLGLVVLKI